MSHQEILFPSKTLFSTEIPIRKIDLSMDLHVSFASILDLVFEAHLQFFEFLGYSVTDIHGKSIIFANLQIQYQGELFYKDQVRVDVSISNMQEKYFDLYFRLMKNESVPVSLIKIRVLCFDYSTRKVSELPTPFKDKFPEEVKQKEMMLPLPPASPSELKWKDMEIRKSIQELALKVYKYTEDFPPSEEENLTMKLRSSAVELVSSLTQSYHNKMNSDKIKFVVRLEAGLKELEELLILSNNLGFGKDNPPFALLKQAIHMVEEFRTKIFSAKKIYIKEDST
jgi:four helix bundle protein